MTRRQSVERGFSPSVMAGLLWNHAPAMWAAMERKGVARPEAGEQQAADLFVYFFAARFFEQPVLLPQSPRQLGVGQGEQRQRYGDDAYRHVQPEDRPPVGHGKHSRPQKRTENAAELLYGADHAQRCPTPSRRPKAAQARPVAGATTHNG